MIRGPEIYIPLNNTIYINQSCENNNGNISQSILINNTLNNTINNSQSCSNSTTIINITEGNTTRNYNGPTKGLDDELNIDLRVYV